jgi:PAS domain S-box-containing protein
MSSTRQPKPEAPPPDFALLRDVLDAAPARICVVSPDRRYLYVNREFAQFAGRPPEAIVGMRTRDLVGEEVADRLDPFADRALAGEVVSLEGWIDYRRNARRFIAWTFTPWHGTGPDIAGFILFMRDLTDLKRREEEAERRRAHLMAIMGGIADGVNILDPEGRLVVCNRGFLEMYGFPEHLAAPGTPLQAFVRDRVVRREHYLREDPRTPDEAVIAARVAEIMGSPDGRFEEVRPDGRTIEVRRERLPDGTLVNTYTDITARREAERARRASRDALRRAERLSAIASLLGGVAHEINNPLAVVAAQALLLAEEAEGTPLAERAEKVRLAAERCGRIVTSLLASARQKPVKRERVDLAAAVEAGLDLTAEVAREAGIRVSLEIAGGLPPVLGDADQLTHVVGNLVANARAALAGLAGLAGQERWIRVSLGAAEGGLELRVADNGPGIPEPLRGRVFDPFFTTKPEGEGSGVGLALCRTVVRAHGGDIRVEDTPGGGATLVVRLPAAR